MIFELLLEPFWIVLNFIVSLIPDMNWNQGLYVNTNVPMWFLRLLSFFPDKFFITLFGSVVFYSTIHFTWSVIEWIYKKIPGVD